MVKKEITENNQRINTVDWVGNDLVVKTRSGKTYKFQEQNDKVIADARDAATYITYVRNKPEREFNEGVMMTKIIVKSCVEPILKETEFDLSGIPGSEAIALRKAMEMLYDLDVF